jgi:hypothetical protein
MLGGCDEINDPIGAVRPRLALGVIIAYSGHQHHEKIGAPQRAFLDRVELPRAGEPLPNDLRLGSDRPTTISNIELAHASGVFAM